MASPLYLLDTNILVQSLPALPAMSSSWIEPVPTKNGLCSPALAPTVPTPIE